MKDGSSIPVIGSSGDWLLFSDARIRYRGNLPLKKNRWEYTVDLIFRLSSAPSQLFPLTILSDPYWTDLLIARHFREARALWHVSVSFYLCILVIVLVYSGLDLL